MVKVNDDVRDTEPVVAATVTVYDPIGADGEVDSVRFVAQSGVHDETESDAVTPVGRAEAIEKETASTVPDMAFVLIVVDADCPCVTTILLGVERLSQQV